MLVAEINDCDWDKNTQTVTTLHKKKQDHNLEELETATRYKNAFNLKGLGKAAKSATKKAPESLFDFDAKNSVKTIHNHHFQDENNDSKVIASAATASLATPPRKNSTKDPTNNIDSSFMVPPSQDKEVGEMCAAVADSRQQRHIWIHRRGCMPRVYVD